MSSHIGEMQLSQDHEGTEIRFRLYGDCVEHDLRITGDGRLKEHTVRREAPTILFGNRAAYQPPGRMLTTGEIIEGTWTVFESLGYATHDAADALRNLAQALAGTNLASRPGEEPEGKAWAAAHVVVTMKIEPGSWTAASDADRSSRLSKIRWLRHVAGGESILDAARGEVSADDPILASPGEVKALRSTYSKPSVPAWKKKQIEDQLRGVMRVPTIGVR